MWAIRNRMDRKPAAGSKKFTNEASAKSAFDDLGGNNRNEYRCHASFGCDCGRSMRGSGPACK